MAGNDWQVFETFIIIIRCICSLSYSISSLSLFMFASNTIPLIDTSFKNTGFDGHSESTQVALSLCFMICVQAY